MMVTPTNANYIGLVTTKLTSTDGNVNPGLGASVAIEGRTVVAGAVQGFESSSGAAYVFVAGATGWTNMTQTAELTASDATSDDFLGCGVGISGDTVIASAPNVNFGSNSWQGAV